MGSIMSPKFPQFQQLKPPEPKPAAPMPDPQSTETIEARRRAQAELMRRGGRASTILSAPERRGGGNTYSSAKVG